ncbi:amidohydrolase family protein [Actinophytocola sp. NPDC049390]
MTRDVRLDEALAAFGPHRLMWGSDWPVCLKADGGGTRRHLHQHRP